MLTDASIQNQRCHFPSIYSVPGAALARVAARAGCPVRVCVWRFCFKACVALSPAGLPSEEGEYEREHGTPPPRRPPKQGARVPRLIHKEWGLTCEWARLRQAPAETSGPGGMGLGFGLGVGVGLRMGVRQPAGRADE